jgi:hypothetical protein
MAKVKIQGNAIGTGTLTLTAPNTNSDRIITLPDGTGELLAKDSSGNLGIGTSSPSQLLHIYKASGGVYSISENTSGKSAIGVASDGTVTISAESASNDIRFLTSSGGTERMRIDSAGRVTMPYQPAFSQKGTNTYTWTTTGGLDFTSSNVWASGTTLTNVGGHFNASTGRFTAPVDGAYAITLSVFSSFTSGYFYVYIMKNGVEVTSRNNAQSSGNLGQTLNVILDLSANDYIQAHTESNYTGCSTYRPLFSGFLIG